jgi:phosphopantetheinyl transferase (holo-ACP synthase)
VEGQSWRADQIAIRSGVDQRNSQRPEIFLPNQQSVNWNLSISHSGSVVYAAIIPQLGLQIGVDVVDRQPLGHGFLPSWFTTRECEVIGEEDETALQCRAWAIKEAAYKAANRGEGFSPRTLKIESKFQNGGFRCSYRPVNSTSRDIRWTQAICITDERWEAAVAICSDQNRRGAIVFDLIVNDLATVFTNPPSNSMDAEGIVFRNYSLCSYSCHQEQHICAGYSSANQSSSILREFVS